MPEESRTCPACGAGVSKGMRYCISCYQPLSGPQAASSHTSTARSISSTLRPDPAVVFNEEEHRAIIARRIRRRRKAIGSLIVLLIVAVAGAAYFVRARHERERQQAEAREKMARRELSMLAAAVEQFKIDIGRYPDNREGLGALLRRPPNFGSTRDPALDRWDGPYLDGAYEVDPWGNDYIYHSSANGFEIYSLGPGGSADTEIRIGAPSP